MIFPGSHRKLICAVVVGLLLIIPLFILQIPQRLVRALVFLSDIQGAPTSEWASQTSFAVRKEEIFIEPSLRARIYRPVTAEKTAGLVLIPGLHPRGIDEPRVDVLASAIARQGFTVLAPDIMEFRRFQITERVIELIVQAAQFLIEQRKDIDPNKVGIFGVSYSAGPALIAASREEIADKIAFIVSVGGYYHLGNPIEYVLTGTYSLEGEQVTLPPHPWARMIFALNNLDLLAPAKEVPKLEQALRCYLQLDEVCAKQAEACLSEDGKEFLSLIIGPIKPELYARMSGAQARVSHMAEPLSPAVVLTPEVLKRVRARIYLLHGAKDDVIPCSETWQLAQALKERHHPAHAVLITKGLTHVDSAEKSLSWYEKITEAGKLFFFMTALMDER